MYEIIFDCGYLDTDPLTSCDLLYLMCEDLSRYKGYNHQQLLGRDIVLPIEFLNFTNIELNRCGITTVGDLIDVLFDCGRT